MLVLAVLHHPVLWGLRPRTLHGGIEIHAKFLLRLGRLAVCGRVILLDENVANFFF